ncbi:MAG: PTS sugar transporter subunit IIA [Bradymonadia bacterium]|jgi:PTS system mannose-specific IIA component
MIGVVVCTHGSLAEGLVSTALLIVGEFPALRAVALLPGDSMEDTLARLRAAIAEVDDGSGVLILCDMFGGTPSNLSLSFLGDDVEVVTGASLPMLLKLFTSRDLPLREAATTVAEHARQNTLVAGTLLRSSGKSKSP